MLDPTIRSQEAQEFEAALQSKVIGQPEAIRAFVDIYQMFRVGMSPKSHPVGNFLFLGPTGSGKTRIVEAAAEILFDDVRAVTKIDCAEFRHSHEIAKLIGSPPGYLGHNQTPPRISNHELSLFWKDNLKLSFLLFDEIEKASDALWHLLLGMLDRATLTLGDNEQVDLTHTMIFLTSNLGGKEIMELMVGGMGFQSTNRSAIETKIDRVAQEAAKRKFSPELMNRFDKIVVFNPLQPDQLEQILDIELGLVQDRLIYAHHGPCIIRVSPAARKFLLKEGTDIAYGARHLKRTIEKYIVCPLSNLLATEQLKFGEVLCVEWDEKENRIYFEKETLSAQTAVK